MTAVGRGNPVPSSGNASGPAGSLLAIVRFVFRLPAALGVKKAEIHTTLR